MILYDIIYYILIVREKTILVFAGYKDWKFA